MSEKIGRLGDTFYFNFVSNDTSGSAVDGTSPACDVRLHGAASSAAAVHSPTPVLLSDASYPNGCYEVSITASSGNGFSSGQSYAVYVSLTADSQTPAAMVGYINLALA